jgi:hypothetical protein
MQALFLGNRAQVLALLGDSAAQPDAPPIICWLMAEATDDADLRAALLAKVAASTDAASQPYRQLASAILSREAAFARAIKHPLRPFRLP